MRAEDVRPAPSVLLGRYALHEQIAAGGMASVYLARLVGPVGFSRTVAIKKLHPQYASDPEFATMFLDEARLAARVRHPNVIQTLDVVSRDGELFHVMEYVHGQTLAQLVRATFRRAERVPPIIACNVMMGALHGLHAAHEATDEKGTLLHIVHRDVSPQNIFVGSDGVPRVLDFGVAKAIGRLQSTSEGQLKGKLGYMSPEQVRGKNVSPQTDVFAASVVLWEVLAGRRLYVAENQPALFLKVLEGTTPDLAEIAPETPPAIVEVIKRGLARDPRQRFASARQMAVALERAVGLVSAAAIGEWVERIAHDELSIRAKMVSLAEITAPPSTDEPGPVIPTEVLDLDTDHDPDTLEDESSTDPVKSGTEEELDEILASEASTIDDSVRRSSPSSPSQNAARLSKPHETRTTLRMSPAQHASAASLVREPPPSGETSAVGVAASLRAQAMPDEPRAPSNRWILRGLALAIAVGAAAAFAVKGVSGPEQHGSSPAATSERKVDEPATDVSALAVPPTPAPAPAPTPNESAAPSDVANAESAAPSASPAPPVASATAVATPTALPLAATAPPNASAHAAPRASHAASAKPPSRESLYGMH